MCGLDDLEVNDGDFFTYKSELKFYILATNQLLKKWLINT